MKSSVDNLLTADCPNVLRAHTPKTFNRRGQTSLFISQCLLNKYAPGRSNLTEIHYHKYLNLCSLYNELNKFSYNKVYPKLFEPSSKAIIDCLTLQPLVRRYHSHLKLKPHTWRTCAGQDVWMLKIHTQISSVNGLSTTPLLFERYVVHQKQVVSVKLTAKA